MITLQERVHAAPKPNDWQLDKLHHVFRVRRGNKNTGMKEENLLSLSYGRIVQKDIETSEGLLPENFEGYQIVEPGNIVLRLTDLQNDKRSLRQGLVTQRGIITSAYDAVEVQRNNDPRFWFYSLLALDLAKHYYSLGGGVRQSVKFADFPNDWVYRPDLATQRQIAEFLDRETARIDLLIEKKQRLVALLGEKIAETIRQSVSWGMDSNVPKKPSRVPAADGLAAHWTEQRLSTICRFVQGKAHEPFIEDDGEYICVTARFVSTNGEKFRRCTKNLTPGKVNDIAMVMSDLPNGRALARAFLVDQEDLFAINQRVCAITVMEGDPRFFYYQLDRNFQLLRYNDGFNQTHLPNRAFTQLFLKVPPVEEQGRIADYLDAVTQHTNAVTEKTKTSIDRLKEYRSALITAAVTGQIDVLTYAKSGTPDRRLDAIQEEMGA